MGRNLREANESLGLSSDSGSKNNSDSIWTGTPEFIDANAPYVANEVPNLMTTVAIPKVMTSTDFICEPNRRTPLPARGV